MQEIAISKFKATCLAVLEKVRKTRRPVLVTKFGKPVAQITPPGPEERQKCGIGALDGTFEITGDIISPVTDEHDWEVQR